MIRMPPYLDDFTGRYSRSREESFGVDKYIHIEKKPGFIRRNWEAITAILVVVLSVSIVKFSKVLT